MIKANQALGVQFELPDKLTVKEMDDYQAAVQKAIERLGPKATLTDMRYYAVVHVVANECGVIRNWQSETMPDPLPKDIDAADAGVIYFSGLTVRDYIREITVITPKASSTPPSADGQQADTVPSAQVRQTP